MTVKGEPGRALFNMGQTRSRMKGKTGSRRYAPVLVLFRVIYEALGKADYGLTLIERGQYRTESVFGWQIRNL